jgi:hypothetical protein
MKGRAKWWVGSAIVFAMSAVVVALAVVQLRRVKGVEHLADPETEIARIVMHYGDVQRQENVTRTITDKEIIQRFKDRLPILQPTGRCVSGILSLVLDIWTGDDREWHVIIFEKPVGNVAIVGDGEYYYDPDCHLLRMFEELFDVGARPGVAPAIRSPVVR